MKGVFSFSRAYPTHAKTQDHFTAAAVLSLNYWSLPCVHLQATKRASVAELVFVETFGAGLTGFGESTDLSSLVYFSEKSNVSH